MSHITVLAPSILLLRAFVARLAEIGAPVADALDNVEIQAVHGTVGESIVEQSSSGGMELPVRGYVSADNRVDLFAGVSPACLNHIGRTIGVDIMQGLCSLE